MSEKLKKHTLGTRYGFHQADSTDEPTPLDNVLAISAWHSALSRMIAYTWENWENEKELGYIVKFPEYYLAKFGFFPQIPAYQTKVRFVIKKGDSVTFTHGSTKSGGTISASTSESTDAEAIVNQLQPCPEYIVESTERPTTPEIQSVTSLCKNPESASDEEIKALLNIALGLHDSTADNKLDPLHNGWEFENMSELTGCFIVTIPPKPNLQNIESPEKKSMVESQAISDFMDICRSQPFTSC